MCLDRAKPILWIIVPCYNEEEVLPITAQMFLDKLKELVNNAKIHDNSKILLVDDGSSDRTWDIIKSLSISEPHILGMSQSRNRGHQSSLLAGLIEAKSYCDITISIDCDGQDDINAMNQMIDEWYQGAEVVYGVRFNRDTDSAFKRRTAQGFYKLLNLMGGEVVYNHADYRLISSKVLQHLAEYEEVNLFLRGLIPLVGFKSTSVEYARKSRIKGESHYPLSKEIGLAIDGITSLSIRPLSIIAVLGIVVSLIGLIGIIWAIVNAVSGYTVTGWASLMCVVCFLGGVQLLSLGVIGQYVGKTYLEVKHRPRFIISERTWDEKKQA